MTVSLKGASCSNYVFIVRKTLIPANLETIIFRKWLALIKIQIVTISDKEK